MKSCTRIYTILHAKVYPKEQHLPANGPQFTHTKGLEGSPKGAKN